MKKRQYLNLLLRLMSPSEIALSAKNPTKYMSKTHIALHLVALRHFGMSREEIKVLTGL